MEKQDYESLQKDYPKLPKFQDINREFEISTIETDEFIVRNIRKRIVEKIEEISEFLANILQPDTGSITSMHESGFFSEIEKKDIFSIHTKLMKAKRHSTVLDIREEEAGEAEFIISFFEEWISLKEELSKIAEKAKDSWQEESENPENIEYFG